MSPLAFLAVAAGICIVGVLVLMLRDRQPSGSDHSVREFQREMHALDPKVRRSKHDSWGKPNHDDLDPDEARG